jgi:hypothetical protein
MTRVASGWNPSGANYSLFWTHCVLILDAYRHSQYVTPRALVRHFCARSLLARPGVMGCLAKYTYLPSSPCHPSEVAAIKQPTIH